MVETFDFDPNKSVNASHGGQKKGTHTKKNSPYDKTLNEALGGTNEKIFTHYKEKAFLILTYLNDFGPKSPKEIIAHTAIKDSYNILRKNYYTWFLNPKRGIYMISDIGKQELAKYQKIKK